ncbi:MAG: hypothetical protein AAGI22_07245 [Planctomycetota bacterium]
MPRPLPNAVASASVAVHEFRQLLDDGADSEAIRASLANARSRLRTALLSATDSSDATEVRERTLALIGALRARLAASRMDAAPPD